MDTITIPIDVETARIYTEATAEEQKKMRLLLGLWLRDFATTTMPLQTLMDQVSDRAKERGLTPEILDSLLHAQ